MVLPKRNVYDVEELNSDEAYDFLQLIGKTRALLDDIFSDKAAVVINCHAWRSQKHLHAHVFPSPAGLRHYYLIVNNFNPLKFLRTTQSPQYLRAMAKDIRSGQKPVQLK